MKMNKLRSDSGASEITLTKDPTTGFARFSGVIAREGVYAYSDSERVYVPKELLQDAETNAMLAGLPILIDHIYVDSENAKIHTVGAVSSIPEYKDGALLTTGVISDQIAIDKIETKGYKQLSPSYAFEQIAEDGVFNGENYTHRQIKREYHHLALCKEARGKDCGIIFDSITTEGIKLITVNYKGFKVKFDSQEDADKALKAWQEADKESGKKSDSMSDVEAELEKVSAELKVALAKVAEAGDEAAQKAAEAEIAKQVAEKLQAIIEAMTIAPEEVNADSIKELKYDSRAIMAKALGIKYDSKVHTDQVLKSVLEVAKANKIKDVPEKIKADSKKKSNLSDKEEKLHNMFYED